MKNKIENVASNKTFKKTNFLAQESLQVTKMKIRNKYEFCTYVCTSNVSKLNS